MLRIAAVPTGELNPDEGGWLKLWGTPDQIRSGDRLNDDDFYVFGEPKKGEHDRAPAYTVNLRLANDFGPEGESYSIGRLVLQATVPLVFYRQVEDLDLGIDPECHQELLDDTGYEDYENEHQVPAPELREGWIVKIGDKGEIKTVQVAYPNGLIRFTDQSAYQSQPGYDWIAWSK